MYEIVFSNESLKYISKLPKADRLHIKEVSLLCLGEYIKKVTRRCNKKLLKGSKPKTYRLHISLKYTLFYRIDEENEVVKVIDAMGINKAHSDYGNF